MRAQIDTNENGHAREWIRAKVNACAYKGVAMLYASRRLHLGLRRERRMMAMIMASEISDGREQMRARIIAGEVIYDWRFRLGALVMAYADKSDENKSGR